MTIAPDFLYELLPEFYRTRDRDQGFPLRALLAVASEQYAHWTEDTAFAYDDGFIETCDPQLIPYIAAILGIQPTDERAPGLALSRPWVGNTISFRRRSGTLATLERALLCATGWTIQGKLLPGSDPAPSLPVEESRRPAAPILELLVPRLVSGEWSGIEARRIDQHRFTFDPMGLDAPLFTSPLPLTHPEQTVHLRHLALPITRKVLRDWLQVLRDEVERGATPPSSLRALEIAVRPEHDGHEWHPISPIHWAAHDLSHWQIPEPLPKESCIRVVVDPELGRLVVLEDRPTTWVKTRSSRGRVGDIGGGPYARVPVASTDPETRSLVGHDLKDHLAVEEKRLGEELHTFRSLAPAIAHFVGSKGDGLIRLVDSASYVLTHPLKIQGGPKGECASRSLVIEALDGHCPCLRGDLEIIGGACRLEVTLSGLWLDGSLRLAGNVRLNLVDCTICPRPHERCHPPSISSLSDPRNRFSISLVRSMVGSIQLKALESELAISDSVVDAGAGLAIAQAKSHGKLPADHSLRLTRVTLLGDIETQQLRATDSILIGALRIEFTHAVELTDTYLCPARPRPEHERRDFEDGTRADPLESKAGLERLPHSVSFVSTRYGDPGYAQLTHSNPKAILQGASNGSQLGAFNFLEEPRREQQIHAVLAEYLPDGFDHRIVYR